MQLELDQVECSDEAHFGGLAFDRQGRLGDLQADQVVGDQGAPDLLIDAVGCF